MTLRPSKPVLLSVPTGLARGAGVALIGVLAMSVATGCGDKATIVAATSSSKPESAAGGRSAQDPGARQTPAPSPNDADDAETGDESEESGATAAAGRPAVQRTGGRVCVWSGDNVRQVSPEGGTYLYACIDPDGRDVVYCGGPSWPPRLWRTDLGSGETTALTPPDSAAAFPAYSMDGKWIAFASDRDSPPLQGTPKGDWSVAILPLTHRFDIYIMRRDGSDVRRLTHEPVGDHRPCISPDDRTVAFITHRDGGEAVWTVPADGSGPPKKLVEAAQRPWYSVDGKRVFFHRQDSPQTCGIYWVPAEGGVATRLPNCVPGLNHGAYADLDGQSILVHARRPQDRRFKLWVIPLNGDPPHMESPDGWRQSRHGTRSRNGIFAFDVF